MSVKRMQRTRQSVTPLAEQGPRRFRRTADVRVRRHWWRMLGSADKRPLSAHSGPSPRYVTVPRYFYLIASIALTACTSYDIQPDPVYRETIVRHTRPQVSGEQFDRQEYKSELASIFSAVDVAAERRVGNVARDDNFIFAFWAEKKRLLSKDYGIKWSSPAELSPTVEYAGYGQPRLSAIERRSIASFMKPHLDHEGEEIHHMRRTFDGTVYVYSNYDAVVIQHTLSGHDETWNYENSGELVFD